MLRGHVFSEQVFAVDIFALFINQFLGGNNGIIEDYKNAMEMTNTSNSITIKNGAAVIQGRYLEEHTETTLNYAKTDSLYCLLVIEIDLGKTNTRTSLEQAKYKILEAENDYPTLIQNDIINQTGNIYQFELARFQNGSTGIVNFTDRRNYLSFDSVYSGIIQDNLESDSPTSALSAKQGKILNGKVDTVDGKFNYSTTEKRIGTWIDNKPLYRKVTTHTFVSNHQNEQVNVPHGISNLKMITNCKFIIPTGNGSGYILPFTNMNGSSTSIEGYNSQYVFWDIYNDSWGSGRTLYMLLEYTKTTD